MAKQPPVLVFASVEIQLAKTLGTSFKDANCIDCPLSMNHLQAIQFLGPECNRHCERAKWP